MKRLCALGILIGLLASGQLGAESKSAEVIRIGGKKFTESYILTELFAQLIEANTPYRVERKPGLGSTAICFEALRSGAIDLYPEYTGTIQEALLKSETPLGAAALGHAVRKEFNFEIGLPLGFNNTYAFVVRQEMAKRGFRTITDLQRDGDLRFGLSHEFLERKDGWFAVMRYYGLNPRHVRGLDHGLAYDALQANLIDVTDAYSTDAALVKYDLVMLTDDRQFFPEYLAVPLMRAAVAERFPQVIPALEKLAGRIDDAAMRAMNAEAEVDGKDFASIAHDFLAREGLIVQPTRVMNQRGLSRLVLEHLWLTLVAVVGAILIGTPIGIGIVRHPRWATPILTLVGLLQTIPSIALLAFMIPLFGIGAVPAIVALFLYGLLPIVRNTHAGLQNINATYRDIADGLGLTPSQRLRRIELPLAAPVILAGIKTCAVISIGTATLAAFIGAGGLGEPIVTGLALNDTRIILRGAIPAALLAIATEYGFAWVERRIAAMNTPAPA